MQMADRLSTRSGRHCSWISRGAVLAALLLTSASHGWSQTMGGTVKGKDYGRLMGASVVVANGEGKTVAYAITDADGRFRLAIPDGGSPAKATVSYMGYQTKTIPFSQMRDGMTVTLSEGSFKLREVSVGARRIRAGNDTLTYSVAGFRQKQDRSIADVIAKMPGMEVKSDGKIEFQGKAINKFYIEGLDLMGTQYGIANKNLSADKVMSVQVMQHHQPVKSLRGVSFSDQAALNIVLKDDAKAAWNGAADIGLGYGDAFLYDCRTMGMRFNKRFQALMMYKNNNTGKDIASEVHDLSALAENPLSTPSGIVATPALGTPRLDDERYTFNKSHLVAGNWLWRTGRNSELRLQGNGLMDQDKMRSHSETTYLTIADRPVIVEEQTLRGTRSEWKGEANYQYNGDRTYIRNNLRGYLDFNKSLGWATVNDRRTDMMAKPRRRSLSEVFSLSHTTARNHVYEISSQTSYSNLPEQLLTLNGTTEKLDLRFLSTQNSVKNKLKMGRHYLNNQIGLDYYNQYIGVALTGERERRHTYRLLQPYWQPSLSFLLARHRIDAALKLSYARQRYRRQESNEAWAEPSLRWNWQLSSLSELSASIRYDARPLMGKDIYDMSVFTSYQTRKTNLGETATQHALSLDAGYKYSHPVKGIFFHIRPIYNSTTGNILYESRLEGDLYSLTATDQKHTTTTWGGSSRMSKSFGWAKSILGLGVSYTVSDYDVLVRSQVCDARMEHLTAAVDYSLRPMAQLSVEGKSTLLLSRQRNLTESSLSSGTTTHWQHRLNLYGFLTDAWMMTIGNELSYNSEPGLGTSYFCDLALGYRKSRWELSMSARNIIGTSRYETRVLGNSVETYSVTRLRPRELVMKISLDL